MRDSLDTALRIVADQADDLPGTVRQSIEAAVGLLQIHYHVLIAELALPLRDQSAERLLQSLVAISSIALTTVGTHVLPQMEGEEE